MKPVYRPSSVEVLASLDEYAWRSAFRVAEILEGVTEKKATVDNGTVSFHLNTLEQAGRVVAVANYCWAPMQHGQPRYEYRLCVPGTYHHQLNHSPSE